MRLAVQGHDGCGSQDGKQVSRCRPEQVLRLASDPFRKFDGASAQVRKDETTAAFSQNRLPGQSDHLGSRGIDLDNAFRLSVDHQKARMDVVQDMLKLLFTLPESLFSGLPAGDFRTQLRGSCFNAMFQIFVQYPQFLLSCNQIPVFFDGRFIGRKKKICCLMKICGNVIG
jgi:hypothetical protein